MKKNYTNFSLPKPYFLYTFFYQPGQKMLDFLRAILYNEYRKNEREETRNEEVQSVEKHHHELCV